MSRIDDLAEWFGGNRLENSSSSGTTTIYGYAVSNSENGFVDVIIGNDTLTQGDSGIVVTIPTTVQVKEGDSLIILLTGTSTGKEARVIGVVGRGDETAKDIEDASQSADDAKEEIAETNKYFYHDDDGSHIKSTYADNAYGMERGSIYVDISKENIGIYKKDFMVQTQQGFHIIPNTNSAGVKLSSRETDDKTFAFIGENDAHYNSFRIGWDNSTNGGLIADGDCSIVAGQTSTAFGQRSIAVGDKLQCNGALAGAFGRECITNGNYSYSFGEQCSTNKDGAFATGKLSKANGEQSMASGYGCVMDGSGAAFGKFNETTDALFVVGMGTENSKRKDAFVIDNDGNARFSGDISSAVTSGSGTIQTSNADGTITYVKSGNTVQINCWFKFVSGYSGSGRYSQIKDIATGLPAAYADGNGFVLKIDGQTGTVFGHVDENGSFWIEARETELVAGSVVVGSFSYISA